MGDLIEYNSSPPSSAVAAPPSSNNRNLPVREDCWSEEATVTLVEAWGSRYVELNRGNLRQKDWQEVADTVNSLHGHSKKTYRTDVQCKNRIDTVKKKYKVEKARVVMSNGSYVSSWIFYNRLDVLIGPTTPASGGAGVSLSGPSSSSGKKAGQQQQGSPVPLARSPPVGVPLLPYRKVVPVTGVGVGPGPVVAIAAPTAATAAVAVSLPHKRERERDIRRNYSEVAAAAAAAEDMEDDDDELDRESEDEEELEKESEEEGDEGGMRRLAKAIERFGEVYMRVEGEKLRQMVELEKQRMQFAKDLEVQRLKMFMDTQVQMERHKHAKRTESDDIYS